MMLMMRNTFFLVIFIAAAFLFVPGADLKKDYPIRPVAFTQVRVSDGFWAPKMETNRTVTVPFALRKNEETGRVDNFRKAAGMMKGPFQGKRYNDSDIYKVMEGASYTLMLHPDPDLKKRLDDLIAIIGKAQEPDGYLYTTRTIDPKNPAPGAGKERWSNLRVSHELYNVGHMYEAAAAHYAATGERSFLNIAVKNADLLLRTFGPGQRRGFPGHQEIEIGLAKLYRATGQLAYLDLAKFFLDERGRYFGGERHDPKDPFAVYDSDEYMQNDKPVLEQDEAVGHAVRAMYMYAGMADVAALGGRPEYVRAIDRLWENVAGKKMYLTGGVGARDTSEAFGDAYELPNATAYTETCAAIGNALWQQRLFLLHGEAKYVDVLERVMYNGLISGVSLDGMSFFYQNPLEFDGKTKLYQEQVGRAPWFEVACCPPNITRFLPSVPGYVYAVKDDILYVNLFMANAGTVDVGGRKVNIKQETRYPWNGAVKIAVEPDKPGEFALYVRVPGWARNEPVPTDLYRFADQNNDKPGLKVNGEDVALDTDKGYARIRRIWKKGDTVELNLPMPVRRVAANDAVKEDAGKIALQRGPLVFCAEGADNGGKVLDLAIPDGVVFKAEFRPDLSKGVVVIKGKAVVLTKDPEGWITSKKERDVLFVPYYAWANRGAGEMAVWLPRIIH
ncbi:MAG: glycoside hydrolase family 127 protein [Candidatus Aminicenantes bacterium]|nr:glycoside hydrolase family 127 protein [Candidatus Aminicenantes bacterium]